MQPSNTTTAPHRSEAEMLMEIHDAQMNASSPEKALYYRMHKEMSPTLIRIINEAFDTSDRSQVIDQTQHVIIAYAQFVASSMSALSLLIGGGADDRLEHRQRVAEMVLELTNEFLRKFLESEKKAIMSGEGGEWKTP